MQFGLSNTARTAKMLDLCKHDMNIVNFCNTAIWRAIPRDPRPFQYKSPIGVRGRGGLARPSPGRCAGNVSIALVSPLIGAISDAYGRVPSLVVVRRRPLPAPPPPRTARGGMRGSGRICQRHINYDRGGRYRHYF